MTSRLARSLLTWYRDHARVLPWRQTSDPYAIWVSEIMLQQTRVETVVPYFDRWMARFPSMQALAEASTDEVLAAWEGLGYYRRALNLQRGARAVVEGGGRVPASSVELMRLPGIGRYTAAAIGAFAFGADEIALDGNLRRVLARLSDLEIDPRMPEGEEHLLEFARLRMPRGEASQFNQALMDLGSEVCVPRTPKCPECPVVGECLARKLGVERERPIRAAKRAIPSRVVVAGVLRRNGRVLIGRRPEGKLLGGLWEFPGGKTERGETHEACLEREMREELAIVVSPGAEIGTFDHAYTHFRVRVHALECRLIRGRPRALEHSELRWARPQELQAFPMGKVDRGIARVIAEDAKPGAHRQKAGKRPVGLGGSG
jgi:A/G-specific adenine glycosylase